MSDQENQGPQLLAELYMQSRYFRDTLEKRARPKSLDEVASAGDVDAQRAYLARLERRQWGADRPGRLDEAMRALAAEGETARREELMRQRQTTGQSVGPFAPAPAAATRLLAGRKKERTKGAAPTDAVLGGLVGGAMASRGPSELRQMRMTGQVRGVPLTLAQQQQYAKMHGLLPRALQAVSGGLRGAVGGGAAGAGSGAALSAATGFALDPVTGAALMGVPGALLGGASGFAGGPGVARERFLSGVEAQQTQKAERAAAQEAARAAEQVQKLEALLAEQAAARAQAAQMAERELAERAGALERQLAEQAAARANQERLLGYVDEVAGLARRAVPYAKGLGAGAAGLGAAYLAQRLLGGGEKQAGPNFWPGLALGFGAPLAAAALAPGAPLAAGLGAGSLLVLGLLSKLRGNAGRALGKVVQEGVEQAGQKAVQEVGQEAAEQMVPNLWKSVATIGALPAAYGGYKFLSGPEYPQELRVPELRLKMGASEPQLKPEHEDRPTLRQRIFERTPSGEKVDYTKLPGAQELRGVLGRLMNAQQGSARLGPEAWSPEPPPRTVPTTPQMSNEQWESRLALAQRLQQAGGGDAMDLAGGPLSTGQMQQRLGPLLAQRAQAEEQARLQAVLEAQQRAQLAARMPNVSEGARRAARQAQAARVLGLPSEVRRRQKNLIEEALERVRAEEARDLAQDRNFEELERTRGGGRRRVQ